MYWIWSVHIVGPMLGYDWRIDPWRTLDSVQEKTSSPNVCLGNRICIELIRIKFETEVDGSAFLHLVTGQKSRSLFNRSATELPGTSISDDPWDDLPGICKALGACCNDIKTYLRAFFEALDHFLCPILFDQKNPKFPEQLIPGFLKSSPTCSQTQPVPVSFPARSCSSSSLLSFQTAWQPPPPGPPKMVSRSCFTSPTADQSPP